MLNILKFIKKDYQTLNKIEVSKSNLIHNYKYLSSLNQKIKIAPVIKSNGYGHGIVNVAKILDWQKPPFFCVDSLYEAYELLKVNITTPILIMGYTDPENFKVKKLPFSFALFDLETAQVLNEYQKGCKVHIFVDSGMNREGIPLSELPKFLHEIKKLSNIKIEGLMSHLASSDNIKDPLNVLQIKNFKKALEICETNGIKLKWIHIQNSDGLELNLKGCNLNMARVGLALYGISTNPKLSKTRTLRTQMGTFRALKPVLTLNTKIIQIKKLNKGDRVGYNGTFVAKRPTTLGVLPIGYYDGVDRRLSNKGWVIVDGQPCKIVGRVSMNITTVNISNVPNPKIGDEVFVYSNSRSDKNSIENAAKICRTIPYDILVHLATSTKRIIV